MATEIQNDEMEGFDGEVTPATAGAVQSADEATAWERARMFRKLAADGKLRVLVVVGRTCVADFYAEGNAEGETRIDVSGLFSNVGDTIITDTYLDSGFKVKAIMWNSISGEIAPIA